MQQSNPEWRPIVGMEGYYEVSDAGQIRSVDRVITRVDGVRSYYKSRPVPTIVTRDGYLKAVMSRHGKRYMKFFHRAVAEAFIGPSPFAGAHVNHKNCQPKDNRLENLEWVTEKENYEHATLNGRMAKKLGVMDVRIIRSLREQGIFLREIASCFSVTESVVSEISNRKSWAWAA